MRCSEVKWGEEEEKMEKRPRESHCSAALALFRKIARACADFARNWGCHCLARYVYVYEVGRLPDSRVYIALPGVF